MTTAQVVETSVTVNNKSPIQDYVHPDDQTQPTFEMTPGFKPFTVSHDSHLDQLRGSSQVQTTALVSAYYILHSALVTFPMVLLRRICLTIKGFFLSLRQLFLGLSHNAPKGLFDDDPKNGCEGD